MYDGLYEVKSGSASASDRSARLHDRVTTHRPSPGSSTWSGSPPAWPASSTPRTGIVRGLDISTLPDNPAEAVPIWFGAMISDRAVAGKGEKPISSTFRSTPMQGVEYLFLHWFLLAFFSSMASYRVRPLTPESCLFEIWSLTTYPERGTRPVMEPTVLPFNSQFLPIPQQDFPTFRSAGGMH
jgi:hypothetical protein